GSAELEPPRMWKLIVHTVSQASQHHGPGRAFRLAELVKRLLKQRARPGVRTDRGRQDAAVAARGLREQVAPADTASSLRRLSESLVSESVLPGPVVGIRQFEQELASKGL